MANQGVLYVLCKKGKGYGVDTIEFPDGIYKVLVKSKTEEEISGFLKEPWSIAKVDFTGSKPVFLSWVT